MRRDEAGTEARPLGGPGLHAGLGPASLSLSGHPSLAIIATPAGAIFAIAAAFVVVEVAFAARYGFHRDELCFLACARKLAWGYVDQPPLTPAAAWLAVALFGDSLVGLRLFPALAGGAVVALTGLIARELGGGRFAQSLAALATSFGTVFLIGSHLFGPTSFDQLAWAFCLLLLVRVLRTGDERHWLLIGLVAGVGLLNKHTVLFFGFGLAVGLLLGGRRDQFRSPWLWIGGALALLIFLPNLVWQAQNGWPTLEMMRSLRERNSGLGAALAYLPFQALMVNPLLVPLWLAGLWSLLRSEQGRPYQTLGWAYVVLLPLLILFAPGKPYYIGPMYVVLLAAGAVLAERQVRSVGRRRTLIAGTVAAGLIALPIALPVLPAEALATIPLGKTNPELVETIGWPELVDRVAEVHGSLPPNERAAVEIYTAKYGQAGAIDLLGPARGLPPAVSGHNNYWLWGPPESSASSVIVVGFGFRPEHLDSLFEDVTLVRRIANAAGVDNQEQGMPIWLARRPRASWTELWPRAKHYN